MLHKAMKIPVPRCDQSFVIVSPFDHCVQNKLRIDVALDNYIVAFVDFQRWLVDDDKARPLQIRIEGFFARDISDECECSRHLIFIFQIFSKAFPIQRPPLIANREVHILAVNEGKVIVHDCRLASILQ